MMLQKRSKNIYGISVLDNSITCKKDIYFQWFDGGSHSFEVRIDRIFYEILIS